MVSCIGHDFFVCRRPGVWARAAAFRSSSVCWSFPPPQLRLCAHARRRINLYVEENGVPSYACGSSCVWPLSSAKGLIARRSTPRRLLNLRLQQKLPTLVGRRLDAWGEAEVTAPLQKGRPGWAVLLQLIYCSCYFAAAALKPRAPALRTFATMAGASRPLVYQEIDGQTRCKHWHSELDIVAIKMRCCQQYYSCISCHDETADHSALVWRKDEFSSTTAVLCGACGHEMTIAAYLRCNSQCPQCSAPFNPRCSSHYHFYFES